MLVWVYFILRNRLFLLLQNCLLTTMHWSELIWHVLTCWTLTWHVSVLTCQHQRFCCQRLSWRTWKHTSKVLTLHCNAVTVQSNVVTMCSMLIHIKFFVMIKRGQTMYFLCSDVAPWSIITCSADAVITWASRRFDDAMFVSYEQLHPNDAFGQVM